VEGSLSAPEDQKPLTSADINEGDKVRQGPTEERSSCQTTKTALTNESYIRKGGRPSLPEEEKPSPSGKTSTKGGILFWASKRRPHVPPLKRGFRGRGQLCPKEKVGLAPGSTVLLLQGTRINRTNPCTKRRESFRRKRKSDRFHRGGRETLKLESEREKNDCSCQRRRVENPRPVFITPNGSQRVSIAERTAFSRPPLLGTVSGAPGERRRANPLKRAIFFHQGEQGERPSGKVSCGHDRSRLGKERESPVRGTAFSAPRGEKTTVSSGREKRDPGPYSKEEGGPQQ